MLPFAIRLALKMMSNLAGILLRTGQQRRRAAEAQQTHSNITAISDKARYTNLRVIIVESSQNEREKERKAGRDQTQA